MLFIHPMWDSESQRVGMRKCWALGYYVREIGELIGFLGILSLLGAIGYVVYVANFGEFSTSIWLILLIPFGLGMVSEFLVQASWAMVSKRGFKYDYEQREASWVENGERVSYRYTSEADVEGAKKDHL